MGFYEHISGDKYRLRVNVGYRANGSPIRKQKTITAKTEKQVERQLILFEEDLKNSGYTIDGDYRFKAFAEQEWLPKYAEKDDNLSYNTRQLYLSYLKIHFFPTIGNKKLEEITPLMIVNIMDNVKRHDKKEAAKPLSKSTKRNIKAAVSSVFEVAVDWRLIKENPVAGIKLGKDMRKEKKIYKPYTTKELAYIYECSEKEPLEMQVLLSIALETGAREGEIAALEQKHIKAYVEEGRFIYSILFEQTLIVKPKIGVVLQLYTKTEVSEEVTIPKELYNLIQLHIKQKKAARDVLGIKERFYLFSNPNGKPYRPNSLYQRFKRFQKRHGIRHVRFHDLRHSNATYMLMEGVSSKIVQERLRHKDHNTTMNIYGHVLKEHDLAAVEVISKMGKIK